MPVFLNKENVLFETGSAFTDLIVKYDWDSVTILYENNDSMLRLKEIFTRTSKMIYPRSFKMVLKQLKQSPELGYRDVSSC